MGHESDDSMGKGDGERVPTMVTDVGPSYMGGTQLPTDQDMSAMPGGDMFSALAGSAEIMGGHPNIPQVMTALGPVPLPEEARRQIPDRFVARPITEEREIYIAKKEVQERVVEVPHVHYQHSFQDMRKTFKIKKLQPRTKEIIREVPREIYKPVIEEKVIEVPQGVKYVEVPVEVHCQYPPKVVPKTKVQIVERVIETVKPVVKEQIVEVPQTVVKQVPKIRTVEVPYYVPRYVEKIIEVPYRPPDMSQLPPQYTEELPMQTGVVMPQPSVLGDFNFQHHMDENGQPMNMPGPTPGPMQGDHLIRGSHFRAHHSGPNQPPVDLPNGYTWGAPPGVAPPKTDEPNFFSLSSCMPGVRGQNGTSDTGNIRMSGGDGTSPMLVTCPPEFGNVKFAGKSKQPEILTSKGTVPYNHFKKRGNATLLFPPLAQHEGVELHPVTGAPVLPDPMENVHPVGRSNTAIYDDIQMRMQQEREQNARNCNIFCTPCDQDQQEGTHYLQ